MNQGSSEAPAHASLQEAPDPTAGRTLS
ncbi:MAG: hypothetical protein QOG36_930, partial [Actinomycetota bacterium]|nr:hypothetical protein [Actinomycetota bacterium]